jgi:hypothetical protein
MADTQPIINREKLAAVLARLESPYDGERATAGLLASQMIRKAGLSWREVVDPPKAQARRQWQPPPEEPPQDEMAWWDMVTACLARPELLTDWECEFLISLSRRSSLTDKQRRVLERLHSALVRP